MGSQSAKEKSEINTSSTSEFVNSPLISTLPELLAWCEDTSNKIKTIDLETKRNYVTFEGARINDTNLGGTHVKEIPNTKLLVSLHHNYDKSANIEIFDISKKGKANKIYSLGEVSGMVGYGDVSYNSRRSILGAIPVAGRIAYHLFIIDTNAVNTDGIVKLSRKTKWHSQYGPQVDNHITGFDFNPAGETIATIDRNGMCLISNVNTNNYVSHLQVGYSKDYWHDYWGRCRWSTNTDEPFLFMKYDHKKLNILDVEKKVLTLSNPVELDKGVTCWIDVSQSNPNLLASGGQDNDIKIFDKRTPKIVTIFEDIHSVEIYCVLWNPSGDMIASASWDSTAKVLDIKTGKMLHAGTKSYGSKSLLININ